MSSYAYHNLSAPIKQSAKHIFKAFSTLAETFVYAYLGVCVGLHLYENDQKWSVSLVICTCILCAVSRGISIVVCAKLANLFSSGRKLSKKFQVVLWVAGIRGAVAFALVLNVTRTLPRFFIRSGKVGEYLVSTTMLVVLISTLFCGAVMEVVVKDLEYGRDEEEPVSMLYREEKSLLWDTVVERLREFNDRRFLISLKCYNNNINKDMKKVFGGYVGEHEFQRIVDVDE